MPDFQNLFLPMFTTIFEEFRDMVIQFIHSYVGIALSICTLLFVTLNSFHWFKQATGEKPTTKKATVLSYGDSAGQTTDEEFEYEEDEDNPYHVHAVRTNGIKESDINFSSGFKDISWKYGDTKGSTDDDDEDDLDDIYDL